MAKDIEFKSYSAQAINYSENMNKVNTNLDGIINRLNKIRNMLNSTSNYDELNSQLNVFDERKREEINKLKELSEKSAKAIKDKAISLNTTTTNNNNNKPQVEIITTEDVARRALLGAPKNVRNDEIKMVAIGDDIGGSSGSLESKPNNTVKSNNTSASVTNNTDTSSTKSPSTTDTNASKVLGKGKSKGKGSLGGVIGVAYDDGNTVVVSK